MDKRQETKDKEPRAKAAHTSYVIRHTSGLPEVNHG